MKVSMLVTEIATSANGTIFYSLTLGNDTLEMSFHPSKKPAWEIDQLVEFELPEKSTKRPPQSKRLKEAAG